MCIKNLLSLFFFLHFFACCIAYKKKHYIFHCYVKNFIAFSATWHLRSAAFCLLLIFFSLLCIFIPNTNISICCVLYSLCCEYILSYYIKGKLHSIPMHFNACAPIFFSKLLFYVLSSHCCDGLLALHTFLLCFYGRFNFISFPYEEVFIKEWLLIQFSKKNYKIPFTVCIIFFQQSFLKRNLDQLQSSRDFHTVFPSFSTLV